MAVTITHSIENIDGTIAVYDTIRLYADASPSAVMTVIVDTELLVANQSNYVLTDANGTVNTWYRVRYFHTTTAALSDFSPPFQVAGSSLLKLRLEAGMRANVAFASTCTSNGTTLTLVDLGLSDSGLEARFLEGVYIYRPNAVLATDRVRRVQVNGFTPATGALAPTRAWTNLPAVNEVYQIFMLLPPVDSPGNPYSWDRVVNDGLDMCLFEDQVILAIGTSTPGSGFSGGTEQRLDLAGFPQVTQASLRGVFLRYEDATTGYFSETDARMGGRRAAIFDNDQGSYLRVTPSVDVRTSIVARVLAKPAHLYADTDVTKVPIELASKAVALAAFRRMEMMQPGRYSNELKVAYAEWTNEYALLRPNAAVYL